MGTLVDLIASTTVQGFRHYADGLSILIWTRTPDGQIDWANRAWHDYFGLSIQTANTAAGQAQTVHPDDLLKVVAADTAGIAQTSEYAIEHRLKPAAAEAGYRWFLYRLTPHFNAAGHLVSWSGTGTDIHATRMRATERAELLSELAVKEAESFKTIADNVPQMMWSARADGWIDWYNQRWFDYTGQTPAEAAGWGWQSVHHPDDLPRVMQEWPHAVATGEPFTMEFRLRGSDGNFRMFLTRATPVRNDQAAILRWYGTNTDIEHEYNLRMRERRIARTFQEAALQARLPRVAGVTFNAIYEPGQSDALVGGDWFDVFRLLDGRVVFSVGDVAGSGINAAVTMGSLRQSIRTAALINPDPIAVLDAVDRIVRDMSPELMATAFVAVYDAIHAELRYASAGHPPPLLRRPDGDVTTLNHSALPLGLRQRTFEPSPCVQVEPNMLLVMYTDGLTEFGRDPIAGEAKVVATLSTLDASANPAHELYDAVVDAQGPHDDIAILTALFHSSVVDGDGECAIWRWAFDANDADAALETRHEFAELLAAGGMSTDDVTNAELVFGELVGNVLRYASQTVRVALDRTSDSPVLHVLDEGTGFEHNPRLPTDLLSEKGRGLFIVSHLTQELSVSRRTAGGSHMRVVLSNARARHAALTT